MKSNIRPFLPHILAYVLLLVLSVIRFAPVVLEGKVLQQSDNMQAKGMQAESLQVREETGRLPLWTNSMFGGMPTFQIQYPTKGVLPKLFHGVLLSKTITTPHTSILLMMAGFYLLMVVLGADWRVALVGAAGFGLAANHMGLVEAGHSTKVVAAAYSAPVLAGLVLTFRGQYLMGFSTTALFLALQLYANHVQITYLLFLTLAWFGLAQLVDAVRRRTLPRFVKASLLSVAAVAIGFACNTGRLWSTMEYASETIRGTSELKAKEDSSGSSAAEGGGLSKSYAFQWSYGLSETFNLLIPNFKGGSSTEAFVSDPGSASLAALRQLNNPELANQLARYTTHYWGDVPFTSGPVYLGVVFILLGIMGLFLTKGPFRWYLVASIVFTILLSWGRNFPAFNYFIFDHFPYFNKFRDATTALGTTNLLLVIAATLGLQQFLQADTPGPERRTALTRAGLLTGSLLAAGLVLSFLMDYQKPGDDIPASLAAALAEDRAALLRSDLLRSAAFAVAAFGVLWLSLQRRLGFHWLIPGIGLLALLDIWGVGSRFVREDSYVTNLEKSRAVAPTAADEQIMADPDPHFRVADFRRNPFSNAFTSYHHKSMGGYHAAKLMRYQELIERYLGDPQANSHIYGMFNARYFIGQNDQVIQNPDALGHAWFVESFEIVPDGDAEIAALADLEPGRKAVVQEAQAGLLRDFSLQFDSNATIRLTRYHPDEMTYQYEAASEQLAVFPEMYYPPAKGWQMYIDGDRAPDFFKADFTLRAARLPAGQHELKMVFHPTSYYTGEFIANTVALLTLLCFGFALYRHGRQNGWPAAANLTEPTPPARKRPDTGKPRR